jgi:hypothetical protein
LHHTLKTSSEDLKKAAIISSLSILCIALLLVGCNIKKPVAEFTLEMDPNMPGKIITTNSSTDATRYYWEYWEVDANGDLSTTGANSTVSTDEDAVFIIPENATIAVDLYAMDDRDNESFLRKEIEVSNIPSTLTIGKLVITRINSVDEFGAAWDSDDTGPDLLLSYRNEQQFEGTNVNWDVDLQSDLPYEIQTNNKTYTSFSPQTADYYLALIDFDGNPGSMFLGPGTMIDGLIFNPYHLTHLSNPSGEGNYPSVYQITTEGFDAELYMNWE